MLKVRKFKQLHFFSFCGLHRNESVVSILKVSYNTFYDILNRRSHTSGREQPPCWHLIFVYRGGYQIQVRYSRAEFSVIQLNIRPVGFLL